MGLLKTLFILIHVIPILLGLCFILYLESGLLDRHLQLEKPAVVEKYWGPGSPPTKESTAVQKIVIKVPEDMLNDLRNRLKTSRLAPSLEKTNFEYGVPADFKEQLRQHWLNKYNWRTWEKQINSLPNFKTRIQGLDMHFIHVKPTAVKGQKILPLLLIHGWPGSVVEFLKVIPLLTKPPAGSPYAFEIVAPSLPGYGWSEAAKKPGLGTTDIALIFFKLMKRLNLTEPNGFYIQGGDWGSEIAEKMIRMQPELTRGCHVNMLVPPIMNMRYTARLLLGMINPNFVLEPADQKNMYPHLQLLGKILRESGYLHIQATRPDTVGTAVNESPLGLAAYIIEKFAAWTDPDFRSKPDGGLKEYFSLDELLTNVMVYWVTGSITSSMRLYKESIVENPDWWRVPTDVPVGAAAFPNDLVVCPEAFYRFKYPNLIHYTKMARGGHFAAMERPKVLVDDFMSFVTKTEEWWTKKTPANKKEKTDL